MNPKTNPRDDEFTAIYNQHGRIIYQHIIKIVRRHEDAADIHTEVFLKYLLQIQKNATIEDPGAWLYVVAQHHCYKFLRKKLGHQLMQNELLSSQADLADHSDPTIARELSEVIKRGIESMPAQRRKVYEMLRQQGLSRDEVATQLNISPATVKTHLTDAIKTLRKYITDHTGFLVPAALLVPVSELISANFC